MNDLFDLTGKVALVTGGILANFGYVKGENVV
jgi:hypothetical protein